MLEEELPCIRDEHSSFHIRGLEEELPGIKDGPEQLPF